MEPREACSGSSKRQRACRFGGRSRSRGPAWLTKHNGAEQSPESRLLDAGFTRRLEFWCPPEEERALNLNDALAMLEAGEVQPDP